MQKFLGAKPAPPHACGCTFCTCRSLLAGRFRSLTAHCCHRMWSGTTQPQTYIVLTFRGRHEVTKHKPISNSNRLLYKVPIQRKSHYNKKSIERMLDRVCVCTHACFGSTETGTYARYDGRAVYNDSVHACGADIRAGCRSIDQIRPFCFTSLQEIDTRHIYNCIQNATNS